MPRFLLAVVVVLAAAGCSLSSETSDEVAPTTHERQAATPGVSETRSYVARADDLCENVAERVVALDVRERVAEVERTAASDQDRFDRTAAIIEEQHRVVAEFADRLDELGLPREHRNDAERMHAAAQQAAVRLGEAIDRLREGDERGAVEALQRYGSLSQKSARIAALSKLDFEVCGAGV